MCEWTKVADVKMIAIFFDGEFSAWYDAMPSVGGAGLVNLLGTRGHVDISN
jgi:hypothetical protein